MSEKSDCWTVVSSCIHNPRLPSYIARTVKEKLGLGKMNCSSLFEPHLDGTSPFAGGSGYTTAGVTLRPFFSLLLLSLL